MKQKKKMSILIIVAFIVLALLFGLIQNLTINVFVKLLIYLAIAGIGLLIYSGVVKKSKK